MIIINGNRKDSNADLVIDAIKLSDSLTDVQTTAIINRIKQKKLRGIWSKTIALYGEVGGSAAAHKWNWKDVRDLDAAYRLTFAGTLTHSATGILPDGSTGYADTHIAPSTVLTLNDTHGVCYIRTNNTTTGYEYGVRSALSSDRFVLLTKNTDTFTYGASANGLQSFGNIISDTRGYIGVSRLSSTTLLIYRNGTQIGTVAVNSAALPTHNLFLFANNNQGTAVTFGNRAVGSYSFGQGLTAQEWADDYTDEQAFQTALSRNV